MLDTPEIAETAVQPAAIIRLTIPREEIRNVMGPAYGELMAAVAAEGLGSAWPWFTHHLRMDPGIFDLEVGVPLTGPIPARGRVQPGHLPAATVARTVYHGPYEGLASAWAELDEWIIAAGHTSAPSLWERYLVGPESGRDPRTWRTELNRPLARQSAALDTRTREGSL
jgi:effector-binding domain-containing protein